MSRDFRSLANILSPRTQYQQRCAQISLKVLMSPVVATCSTTTIFIPFVLFFCLFGFLFHFLNHKKLSTLKKLVFRKVAFISQRTIYWSWLSLLLFSSYDSPWRIFQEENPMVFRAFIIWWYVFLSQDSHKSMSKFLVGMCISKGDLQK